MHLDLNPPDSLLDFDFLFFRQDFGIDRKKRRVFSS